MLCARKSKKENRDLGLGGFEKTHSVGAARCHHDWAQWNGKRESHRGKKIHSRVYCVRPSHDTIKIVFHGLSSKIPCVH